MKTLKITLAALTLAVLTSAPALAQSYYATPRIDGGYNLSNGSSLTRSVGGVWRSSNGSFATPRVGGGYNFSNGGGVTPSVGGSWRFSDGTSATRNLFGGHNFSNGDYSTSRLGGGWNLFKRH